MYFNILHFKKFDTKNKRCNLLNYLFWIYKNIKKYTFKKNQLSWFFFANLNENHYHKSGLLKRWLQRKGNQTVAWRSLRRWTRKWTKNLKEGGRRGMDFSERNSNKTTEKTLKQVYSFCFQATLKLSACILKSKVIQG